MSKQWLGARVTQVSDEEIQVEIEEVGRLSIPRGDVSVLLQKGDYIQVLFVNHHLVEAETFNGQNIWQQNG